MNRAISTTDWVRERFPSGGFFVEAGAHDGVGDSKTLALEKLGWRGVCVEPSSAFKGLCASRACSVDSRALWSSDGHVLIFREIAVDVELSGLVSGFQADGWDRETRPHKDRTVRTVSLTTLLREHGAPGKIEFLSLDTEGSEMEILGAHDFSAFRFGVISVEHNGVNERRDALGLLLESRGYSRANSGLRDDVFVSVEP